MPIKIEKKPRSAHKDGPQILVFDIETAPHLVWTFQLMKAYIDASQIERFGYVLCYAAKWLGEQSIFFDSVQRDRNNDRRLCETMWDLFDRADVIIGHNGKAFDINTMAARWMYHRMQPPAPYKVIDTYLLARKYANFPRNKLDVIGQYLECGGKLSHEGFSLWKKCMAGNRKAWERMRDYNIQDVLLAEEVYIAMRAWDRRHPNVGMMYGDGKVRCVCCGHAPLKEVNKRTRTNVMEYPTFRCPKCGKTMRGRKSYKQNWGGDNPVANIA